MLTIKEKDFVEFIPEDDTDWWECCQTEWEIASNVAKCGIIEVEGNPNDPFFKVRRKVKREDQED